MALLHDLAYFYIGFYFLFFGGWNAYHWQPTLAVMQQKNIPCSKLLLLSGIVIQSLGGLMLMLMYYVQWVALILIPFDLVAVFIFHAFWTHKDAELRRLNMIIFIANLTATLSALLFIITDKGNSNGHFISNWMFS